MWKMQIQWFVKICLMQHPSTKDLVWIVQWIICSLSGAPRLLCNGLTELIWWLNWKIISKVWEMKSLVAGKCSSCCALVLITIESVMNSWMLKLTWTMTKKINIRCQLLSLLMRKMNFQQIAGYTAGIDYPNYSEVPQGGTFSCQNRLPGMQPKTLTASFSFWKYSRVPWIPFCFSRKSRS